MYKVARFCNHVKTSVSKDKAETLKNKINKI